MKALGVSEMNLSLSSSAGKANVGSVTALTSIRTETQALV
jgi:hypothetical protein